MVKTLQKGCAVQITATPRDLGRKEVTSAAKAASEFWEISSLA